MTPNTDIVISARLTREFPAEQFLDNCIQSVKKNTRNYRVIMVDDNSDKEGAEFIEKMAASFDLDNVILIRTHFQRWFTRAFNIGLRLVRTPLAVALNCDCICDEGWLEELYAVRDDVFSHYGRVGIVGSVLSEEEPRRYHLTEGRGYVTGHAWLLDMEAMAEAAQARGTPGWYLDETKPSNIHIRSDVEICWDLNRLGWRTVEAFKSRVGHIAGKTWGHQLWRIPNQVSVVNERYI